MRTLTIGIEGTEAIEDEFHNEKIIINHFKAKSITYEEARKGLEHSPGIILVVPNGEQISFKTHQEIISVPAGIAMLLNGSHHNQLFEDGESRTSTQIEKSLGIIEISATIDDSFRLKDRLELPNRLDSQDSQRASEIFQQMFPKNSSIQLTPDSSDISQHIYSAQIVSLVLMSTEQGSISSAKAKEKKELGMIRQFILSNLNRNISTTDMADHLGLSRTHFSTKAKAQLGMSPTEYLRRIRMERSLEILEHTSDDIEEVAHQVGYADRFQFSKVFTKVYGYSPVQYRKQCKRSQDNEFYNEARAFFSKRMYKKSIDACLKALRKAKKGSNIDPILFLYGESLSSIGEKDQALDAWEKIEGNLYKWQAGVQKSKLYFEKENFIESLQQLSKLWEIAEGNQFNELIQIWISQVHSIFSKRLSHILKLYLSFRKKYFPSDQQSKLLAFNACHKLRNTMLMLDHCPGDKISQSRAYAFSGEFQQSIYLHREIRDFPLLNYSLLRSGRYEEVLQNNPQNPDQSVKALVALNRPQEAIDQFPEHCAIAHLELQQYEQVLEFHDGCFEKIYALYALGKTEALKQYDVEGGWPWHLAQLFVQPEKLLKVQFPDTPQFIPRAHLHLALQEGSSQEETIKHLEAIPHISRDHVWPQSYDHTILLLRHVMPFFLEKEIQIAEDLKVIIRDWRYISHQMLYYDALFLSKEIKLSEWKQQPYQLDIESRKLFIQGLNHDLKGQSEKAKDFYQKYINGISYFDTDTLLRSQFIKWRMKSLV